jgi:hypothetical protein
LLTQARELAQALGLVGQARALSCAIGVYRARFDSGVEEAVAALEAIAADVPPDDHYSRRSVELELAQHYASAGRGGDARRLLATSRSPTTAEANPRGVVRYLLATAYVAYCAGDDEAARGAADDALARLERAPDALLEMDALAMRRLAARHQAEDASALRLRTLARATGATRAVSYAASSTEGDDVASACGTDRLAHALAVHAMAPGAAASRALAVGALALAARALARGGEGAGAPLVARVGESTLLSSNEGDVRLATNVAPGSLKLLAALAHERHASKESLLRRVWNIAHYRPERHDSVIHTAIARLRTTLGPHASWVQAHDGGFRLASHVAFVGVGECESGLAELEAQPLVGNGDAPSEGSPRSERPGRGDLAEADGHAALCAVLADGDLATSEIASRLGVSEMTAFRRLREAADAGLVIRTGRGKNTRYRLVSSGAALPRESGAPTESRSGFHGNDAE